MKRTLLTLGLLITTQFISLNSVSSFDEERIEKAWHQVYESLKKHKSHINPIINELISQNCCPTAPQSLEDQIKFTQNMILLTSAEFKLQWLERKITSVNMNRATLTALIKQIIFWYRLQIQAGRPETFLFLRRAQHYDNMLKGIQPINFNFKPRTETEGTLLEILKACWDVKVITPQFPQQPEIKQQRDRFVPRRTKSSSPTSPKPSNPSRNQINRKNKDGWKQEKRSFKHL